MFRFLCDVVFRDRFRNIVRKTDDELTRYRKIVDIKTRRLNFEKQLEHDLKSKKYFMNTTEIRSEFYKSLESHEYDKNRINDELSYKFLTEKQNYRPLG
jgi:hypothetical protein